MRSCKICSHACTSWIHPQNKEEFHYCSHCYYIAKDEHHYISVTEEKKRYDGHHNTMDNLPYVAYLSKFLEQAVLPYIQKPALGLDYGSGPNPVLSMIAEQTYGLSMDCYDLFYAPNEVYQGKVYPFITTTEVVEHLEDPLAVFELFTELLEAKGILAIMTQFHYNQEEAFLKWYYVRDQTHIGFFHPKTMEYLAKKFHYTIKYSDQKSITVFEKQ